MGQYRTKHGFTVVVNLPRILHDSAYHEASNLSPPTHQRNAAERVIEISELLEMILLQAALADEPHGIIEVFKIQMVNRSCARAIKESLPLRRILFLEPDTAEEGTIVPNPSPARTFHGTDETTLNHESPMSETSGATILQLSLR
ncbi:hypothetical protein LTR95_007161 [Oleoguttula sp. CCFEE 5521]